MSTTLAHRPAAAIEVGFVGGRRAATPPPCREIFFPRSILGPLPRRGSGNRVADALFLAVRRDVRFPNMWECRGCGIPTTQRKFIEMDDHNTVLFALCQFCNGNATANGVARDNAIAAAKRRGGFYVCLDR